MNENLSSAIKSLKFGMFNRNLLKQIEIAERNVHLSSHELSQLQWRKLKGILSYAYSNCPFYFAKYEEAGLRPEDVCEFDDFQKVPTITKTEIRAHLEEMIPVGIDRGRLEEVRTGGTTGVPLKIYRDRSKHDLMIALHLRTIGLWGSGIGTKIVWIWGIPRECERQYDFYYQSKIRRFLKNVSWFNAFDMSRERMFGFTKFLNSFRPGLIIGYVSALCEYSRFLEDENIRVYPPKAICLTAEPSEPSQRELIERVLGGKTFDEYGSSEILRIAAECSEKNGLHIHADSRYVEILNTSGESVTTGEIGNIIVTDLENKAMPLIRYKNDDIGSLRAGHCRCGLNLPLMNYVNGRIYDMITLKNGKKIYGHMFSRVLYDYVGQIKQFQIHQTSLDRIVVRIVPDKLGDSGDLKKRILGAFRKYTGNQVHYSFEIVQYLNKERSGKLRYVKSDLLH